MAKRISKKTKKTKKRQLVIPTTSSEDEEVPKTPEATPRTEPSSPEKTTVIPPEDSSAKSFHEEVRTSDITIHVFDTDVNVNMGEGYLHQEAPKYSQGSTFERDGLMKAFEARMVSKVSGMFKDSESRILEKVDHIIQTTELRVNSLNSKFVGAVKDLMLDKMFGSDNYDLPKSLKDDVPQHHALLPPPPPIILPRPQVLEKFKVTQYLLASIVYVCSHLGDKVTY
ncbi:unnamed protein product [Lactuca saligna]|uniref:Uncharacterized protein n=1 Tax=Lactuca saligna TaxID=75948 RepID=A0AA35ZX23_LACSI|nr:unnamed protein product [Lactuca saligna]